MWLHIETYVFFGSLFSGVTYMFIRAFIRNAHMITFAGGDYHSPATDNLEANSIAMEMYEAYFAPLVASVLLERHPDYVISGSIDGCVAAFFWS